MLISISITNFKSIKKTQTFSLVAKNKIKELPENVFKQNGITLLKSSIIYGANGSGKSNLIQAFELIQRLVRNSASNKVGEEISQYNSFQLDKSTHEKPIEIEISFISKNHLHYVYSLAFTKKQFIRESLYYYPGKNPALLFDRFDDERIKFGPAIKQDLSRIEEALYDNQLFLSKIGSEKVEALIPAYTFCTRHISVFNYHHQIYDDAVVQALTNNIDKHDGNLKHNIIELLKVADIGIRDMLFKKERDVDEAIETDTEVRRRQRRVETKISSLHAIYREDLEDGEVEFPIAMESTGTNKLLAVGLFLLEGIADGDLIVIDELDKSLHPFITKLLIQIVNSKKLNPKNAQLIFASHDVSLLNPKLFRRDQILLAEKDFKGESIYYSLGDMMGVRKDLPFDKYYMKGVFGGIPLINEYDLEFKFDK